MSVESGAVKVGQFFLSAIIYKIKRYVIYINKCEYNLIELLKGLEKLRGIKDTIDLRVLKGEDNLEILTPKAEVWFELVRELVIDESMKRLMNTDMRVAKVMLRLMKKDLKKLVKDDGEMRDLVVKVMKDVAKRNRKADTSDVSNVDEKDKQVSRVLEKLMEETMDEFKKLMQNDEKMAIAAMHLLENHKERLKKLTEIDEEVAKIIAKARKMSHEEESPSDNHDNENGTKENVVANVNTLRNKVTNLLKPVGDLILNEEVLKTLPENVRLGVEAMGVVIGNKRGLKAELMDSDNINSHRNCCCCVISYNYFSDRYDMSVAAEAMLVTINEVIGNEPGIEDVTRRKRRSELDGIPTNFVELKSRNELLGNIITALASKDVHALGVFGMGGSGKTTLAKEIANSKAKGIFDTTIMVEISESPNIESIQDQIADGLGLTWPDVHGIPQKAIRLYERLMQFGPKQEGTTGDNIAKKILLVLDNIWNKINLDHIGIPSPSDFCKLLLTSREKNVCKSMDVPEVYIFEVGLLSKDEAKHLFQVQVQKELDIGEYRSVADRLLEKCGGLPLSIATTTSSLRGKELTFWRQFAEELEKPISCQISGARQETFSILRTSYEVMASEEKKKFFLLACLSPVGSSISIDNLMRYGIGLDLFQHVNKLSEAIEFAHTWAEELVSSSMLLKSDSEEEVKIHDVVRESTMSFSSKTSLTTDGQMFLVDAIPRWISNETFNKYMGISLLSQANYSRLTGVKADLLKILLLKGNNTHDSFLESNFFQGMKNLKVLEVLFMNFERGLPVSMGKLKDLKTLHLVKCKLGDIKLIGELESLLVLSLRGSSLKELPDEIGKLYNLRLLDLSKCHCEQSTIPASVISRLSLLEGLYLVNSSFTGWANMENTSDDIRVCNREDIVELNNLEFLNVLEISNVESLSLPIGSQFFKNLDKFNINVGQDKLKRHPFERALMVSKFDVSEELKKDNSLKAFLGKADFLSLDEVTINNVVPELGEKGFRDLNFLRLDNICGISRLCQGKAPVELFFNLRQLDVFNLEDLEELLPVNALPHKLTTLEISHCKSLAYIFGENDGSSPSNKGTVIGLHCLKTLKLLDVKRLINVVKQPTFDESQHESFFNYKVKFTALEELSLYQNGSIVKLWGKESNIHGFRNLKVLQITRCDEMETVGPPSMFLSLVHLESLSIQSCKKMQQVISKESEIREIPNEIITFPKLKRLLINNSEKFECFYGGSYKLEFPGLKSLFLLDIERMAKFSGCGSSTIFFPETVKMPSLEYMKLYGDRSIVKLWTKESNFQNFRNLKDLRICRSKLESVGPPSMFISLAQMESLTVESCDKMQYIISKESESQEIPGDVISFPKLKCLTISRLENFESFYDGSYKLKFPCLQNMKLSILQRMVKFGGSGGNSQAFFQIEFPCLEKLKLKCIGEGEDEDEDERITSNLVPKLKTLCLEPSFAPRLRVLKVLRLNKLPSVLTGEANHVIEWSSLETLVISECCAMKSFSTRPLKAPKLRQIIVVDCPEIEWFLLGNTNCGQDLVLSLPSLDEVYIYRCPNLKSFSPSILRAPKLVEVDYNGDLFSIPENENFNEFLNLLITADDESN